MKSKMTRMLEHLRKHPRQKYGQLQTTLYNLDRKKSEQVAKAPSGWSCNNLRVIIDRGVIEQDENGLWVLTEHGKKKINKPYAYTVEDELKHMTKMFEKSRERNSLTVKADLVYRWQRSHDILLVINKLVSELFWDRQRLTDGGKEVLDKIGKLLDNN